MRFNDMQQMKLKMAALPSFLETLMENAVNKNKYSADNSKRVVLLLTSFVRKLQIAIKFDASQRWRSLKSFGDFGTSHFEVNTVTVRRL